MSPHLKGTKSQHFYQIPWLIKVKENHVFATFQVHAYMSSLPEEKVPYIDSIGERHRNKQIIVQLPPYDSEARFCNGLTDEEKRELRIFVALRKRDALDRGVVKQIPDVSEGYGCREVRLIFILE